MWALLADWAPWSKKVSAHVHLKSPWHFLRELLHLIEWFQWWYGSSCFDLSTYRGIEPAGIEISCTWLEPQRPKTEADGGHSRGTTHPDTQKKTKIIKWACKSYHCYTVPSKSIGTVAQFYSFSSALYCNEAIKMGLKCSFNLRYLSWNNDRNWPWTCFSQLFHYFFTCENKGTVILAVVPKSLMQYFCEIPWISAESLHVLCLHILITPFQIHHVSVQRQHHKLDCVATLIPLQGTV